MCSVDRRVCCSACTWASAGIHTGYTSIVGIPANGAALIHSLGDNSPASGLWVGLNFMQNELVSSSHLSLDYHYHFPFISPHLSVSPFASSPNPWLKPSPPTLCCLSSFKILTPSFHFDPFSSLFCFPFTPFHLVLQFHTSSPMTATFLILFCVNQFSIFFLLPPHRDVRRLVVAMSRARLGLYIFARVSLFQNCFELTPAFNQLTARPLQLHIRPHEYFGQEKPVSVHTT